MRKIVGTVGCILGVGEAIILLMGLAPHQYLTPFQVIPFVVAGALLIASSRMCYAMHSDGAYRPGSGVMVLVCALVMFATPWPTTPLPGTLHLLAPLMNRFWAVAAAFSLIAVVVDFLTAPMSSEEVSGGDAFEI